MTAALPAGRSGRAGAGATAPGRRPHQPAGPGRPGCPPAIAAPRVPLSQTSVGRWSTFGTGAVRPWRLAVLRTRTGRRGWSRRPASINCGLGGLRRGPHDLGFRSGHTSLQALGGGSQRSASGLFVGTSSDRRGRRPAGVPLRPATSGLWASPVPGGHVLSDLLLGRPYLSGDHLRPPEGARSSSPTAPVQVLCSQWQTPSRQARSLW